MSSNGGQAEDVFLFVNPSSGGNRGEEFLRIKPSPLPVHLHNKSVGPGRPHRALLHIYSLKGGEDGSKSGFAHLARKVRTQPSGDRVKVIVGGGDGSVMWADTEATKYGIDTAGQLVFGIIPLGTGNDFSRVAGWGSKNPKRISEDEFETIKQYVRMFCAANIRPHDVWQVYLSCDQDKGKILKVQSDGQEGPINGDAKSLSSNMINYFSIGQESKAGIEFEKHRTKSQTCNLFVYAFSGLVTEMKCMSIQHVGQLVSRLFVGDDEHGRCVLCCTDENDGPELKGNPESLMFLNVNSYAGGSAHFWQPSKERYAVVPSPDDADVGVESDPGDQRLEVVTVPSLVNIPLDRAVHMAGKLHSGGPYYIEFYEGEEDMDAFCEVDGEFYHLLNPECVRISLVKTLQVMQRNEDDDLDTPSEFSDSDND